ncbi:MAG TPA: hypothetical protein PLA68_00855 [Panacibacter sp.]|nr:hypothetical protein [Panacibacter sp.]
MINEFSVDDIPGFMVEKEKKFGEHLKEKKIEFKKKLRINFSEMESMGKKYFYFFLEL